MEAKVRRKKLVFSNIILLAIAGWALITPSIAAAQNSYTEHFQDYQAAEAAGDTANAILAAEAAWQAAETELGDHELTGILAYNYGSIVLATKPKSSKKPLIRAKKLHEKSISKLPIDKIKGYLAYVDYVNLPGQDTAVKLREALSLSLDSNRAPQFEDAFMWATMATLEAKQLRFWNAGPAAQMVVKSIESRRLEDKSRPALNNMLILRASTGLSGRDNSPKRITWALDDLDRVIESLGPQEDMKSADPIFVTALAWKAVGLKKLEDQGDTIPDYNNMSFPGAVFISSQNKPDDCGTIWSDQREAKFKTSAAYPQGLYPGYAGAVLISYNISKAGKVEDAKILTQVPNSELGSAALRAFKKWKLDQPPVDHPACRQNQIQSFVYYSEWPPL